MMGVKVETDAGIAHELDVLGTQRRAFSFREARANRVIPRKFVDTSKSKKSSSLIQAQSSPSTKSGSLITSVDLLRVVSNVTGSAKSSQGMLSKQQCHELYSKRRFFGLEEKRLPPMLYTFPGNQVLFVYKHCLAPINTQLIGSGNTWSRLLIEYATGVYTGSVYNDKSLLEALPGEFTCDHRVSAIKVHPHTHAFIPLRDGTFHSDDNKCKRGQVLHFRRAILLIRDPYDSIWSEYQRRITQSHVEGILRSSFDWHRWQANAAQLSHEFNDMWSQHYHGIEKSFKQQDILYLRYEDLKNRTTRVNTLRQVANFLRVPASDERLECAFMLAESSKAHRAIDVDLEMTKDTAYTKPLACKMWKLFGSHCLRHGYNVWKGYTCDDQTPIPRVNVGPRGEYDHKWIKPGHKLLDFGGYDRPGGRRGGPGDTNNEKADSNTVPSALRIKSSHKLVPSKILSLNDRLRGMTLQEAMEVNGLGKLGEDGPIWK
jgi:hypothetical protein